jgi:predicted  nucleic acid-binding Zn-ribbon protein
LRLKNDKIGDLETENAILKERIKDLENLLAKVMPEEDEVTGHWRLRDGY